jgi:hypothetical protein
MRTRPAGTGHILFNTTSTLRRATGPVVNSVAPLYSTRAVVPAVPWLDASPPPSVPSLRVTGALVQITPGAGKAARWWVVRWRTSSGWTTRVVFADQRSLTLSGTPERVLLNAVDQVGNLSSIASWP